MVLSARVVTVFCVAYLTRNVSTSTQDEMENEVLNRILVQNSPLLSPGNDTSPVEIQVSMGITNNLKLDEQNMELTVTIFLRQLWFDEQLKYNDSNEHIRPVTVTDPKTIWMPDYIFWGERSRAHGRDVYEPIAKIYPTGHVVLSRKILLTLSCPLDMKRYPFDQQKCEVGLAAYGRSKYNVIFRWKETDPIWITSGTQLPGFGLSNPTSSSGYLDFNSGTISCVKVSLELSRKYIGYIFHVHLPLMLLVILSWIPFWLHGKQFVSRLLIDFVAVIPCLLMIYKESAPTKLSDLTYTDYFMGACLVFTLISLVETLLVHKLIEREANDCGDELEEDLQESQKGRIRCIRLCLARLPPKSQDVDLRARFIIPLLFLLFCIAYFSLGIFGPSNKQDDWQSSCYK